MSCNTCFRASFLFFSFLISMYSSKAKDTVGIFAPLSVSLTTKASKSWYVEVLNPASSVNPGIVTVRFPCEIVAVPVIGSMTVLYFGLAFTFVRALVADPCLIVLKPVLLYRVVLSPSFTAAVIFPLFRFGVLFEIKWNSKWW